MASDGNTMRRADVESERAVQQQMAEASYGASRNLLQLAESHASNFDTLYWYHRTQALAAQVKADQHAYTEQVLARLLEANPQGVQTYHDDHAHGAADGADGRDVHAS